MPLIYDNVCFLAEEHAVVFDHKSGKVLPIPSVSNVTFGIPARMQLAETEPESYNDVVATSNGQTGLVLHLQHISTT